MVRAISRKPMPEAYAVRISAQVDFVIVRLTRNEHDPKLPDSKSLPCTTRLIVTEYTQDALALCAAHFLIAP
jgi:hypothetical protein